MTHYEEKKEQLITKSNELLSLIENKLPAATYKDSLIDLIADLKTDEHLVTVLGEFKRGKSTLINALILADILPSDVTPTTATINVIKHANSGSATVVMQDGSIVKESLTTKTLKKYTYEENSELEDIHYINIETSLEHLNKKIVIVDTPGVGDLNEHRLDVTYSYIPRSNIIIFVFDATTPIRKSELEYLENTVLKLKYGEIVFVANFIDQLDEEEIEETIEYMTTRLKKLMKDEPFRMFILSSKEGLENTGNIDFQQFVSYLKKQSIEGSASQIKLNLYEKRMAAIFNYTEEDIKNIEIIRSASEEELNRAITQMNAFEEQITQHENTLSEYISNRKQEIFMLTSKSIDHLEEEMKEIIYENIYLYEGPKFKTFIEKNLPVSIKHQLKSWVNNYSPQIDTLIKKLEQEILSGFANLFQKEVNALQINHSLNKLEEISLTIKPKTGSSDTTIKSGLLTAGAGTIMILLSGGLLFPIITLAGFPYLNKLLSEKKLNELKEEVIPHVDNEIENLINKLKGSTHQYIEEEINALQEKALYRFKEHVTSYKQKLELEISKKNNLQLEGLPTIEMNDLSLIQK